MAGTPYDDVFRTLLNDCPKLILPVVNEVFRENYTGNEKIVFSQNEHFLNRQDGEEDERITDTCFVVQGNRKKRYHFECQSTPDSSLLVRMFEYSSQIALDHSSLEGNMLEVCFPHSAVLFLRHAKVTPDTMGIRIHASGRAIEYEIPVMKLKKDSLDEIFNKKLLFLLPFYLFTHESRFSVYDRDPEKLESLRQEYAFVRGRLEELCSQQVITEYMKCTIIDMTNKVAENLAAKYDSIVEGVKGVMGGRILDYEAKQIKNEGIEEGISRGISQGISQGTQQTLIELVHDGLLTVEEAAKRMHKNVSEMKMLL